MEHKYIYIHGLTKVLTVAIFVSTSLVVCHNLAVLQISTKKDQYYSCFQIEYKSIFLSIMNINVQG